MRRAEWDGNIEICYTRRESKQSSAYRKQERHVMNFTFTRLPTCFRTAQCRCLLISQFQAVDSDGSILRRIFSVKLLVNIELNQPKSLRQKWVTLTSLSGSQLSHFCWGSNSRYIYSTQCEIMRRVMEISGWGRHYTMFQQHCLHSIWASKKQFHCCCYFDKRFTQQI